MGYLKVFFYEIAFLMGKMQDKALKNNPVNCFSLGPVRDNCLEKQENYTQIPNRFDYTQTGFDFI
jgi:hypothetical protein